MSSYPEEFKYEQSGSCMTHDLWIMVTSKPHQIHFCPMCAGEAIITPAKPVWPHNEKDVRRAYEVFRLSFKALAVRIEEAINKR